ncbi:DUF1858 domain-containing protein [Citreimonas salinaria]|uniref:Hybrid cluster protein-associated redox disulfide domain-containing protein n=1 Tax=Citreimonas salinaria TaxID=321339 RepID=A0A1H3P2T6_9RHOB|nr:DUF1858 domain-containing protein [Citreimonas salinaria]SDY94729.1 hybrid cluster protein-associated redox disulfide domain-containing protein [Citreimonas salinaria]
MQSPSLDAPDLALCDLMDRWPETIAVFLRYRMLCVGCVIGRFHTVTDACREHDVDEAEFRAALAATVRT